MRYRVNTPGPTIKLSASVPPFTRAITIRVKSPSKFLRVVDISPGVEREYASAIHDLIADGTLTLVNDG